MKPVYENNLNVSYYEFLGDGKILETLRRGPSIILKSVDRFGVRIVGEELAVLVNSCLSGDQISFRELVHRFRGQVYGLCYRMLRHREDAEDATQETFLRVARNLDRWDPERAFEPWLLTIAGNRCRTKLAKRMRRPGMITLEHPVQDDWQFQNDAKLLAEELELALQAVRDDYRRAFMLFHTHELCYDEIARQMDVPLGTVKTWVHRARRELICRLRKRGVLGDSRN